MRARAAVIASDQLAEESAQEFLAAGGSALGAVTAGFFAAAGAYAGVLFGPVSLLTVGVGVGARAFDGRLRQPGLGAKRPRGFTRTETIPDAARLAVPASVDALMVALAYDGQSPGSVLRSAIVRAERSGAEARVALYRRIRAVGAAAMTEPPVVRAVLHVAGASEGGLVTPSDLKPARELDHPASSRVVDGGALVEVPWAETGASARDLEALGAGGVILAVDVRGVFAALAFRRVTDGLSIDELDQEAPLAAVPVERGVARVAPGTPLECPAPIAVRLDGSGKAVEVLGEPSALRATPSAPYRLARDPGSPDVRVVRP